jgi:hypothetical protein
MVQDVQKQVDSRGAEKHSLATENELQGGMSCLYVPSCSNALHKWFVILKNIVCNVYGHPVVLEALAARES